MHVGLNVSKEINTTSLLKL